jgi:hypothetical protein
MIKKDGGFWVSVETSSKKPLNLPVVFYVCEEILYLVFKRAYLKLNRVGVSMGGVCLW